MRTISMRAAIRSWQDGNMYERLQAYCQKMNIAMQVMQFNSEVVIHFTAKDQQLTELENHLESVGVS